MREALADAASRLAVAPGAILCWERRTGFPAAVEVSADQRWYDVADIDAIARALGASLSVADALRAARRERGR